MAAYCMTRFQRNPNARTGLPMNENRTSCTIPKKILFAVPRPTFFRTKDSKMAQLKAIIRASLEASSHGHGTNQTIRHLKNVLHFEKLVRPRGS